MSPEFRLRPSLSARTLVPVVAVAVAAAAVTPSAYVDAKRMMRHHLDALALPWLLLYELPYPVSRLCHAFPVLRPARALLASRIPLGLGPSLHRLRRD